MIDRLDIEKYIQWRKKKGRAPKTINDELMLLQQIWDFAFDIGAATKNPVKKTPRLKVSDRKPPRFLRKEEIPLFLNELNKTAPHLRIIAEFILYTGLRRDEVFHFEWKDIDLKHQKIRVPEGKGGKYREIPLHEKALEAIERFHSEYDQDRSKEGNVFHTLKGTPLTRGKLYESFRRAGERIIY